jgi:hypothetical protein
MSDEEAKAIQEVAKATVVVVKVAGDAGSYLARVLDSIPDDLLGLVVGDWLKHKRRRHLGVLEVNTKRITTRYRYKPAPRKKQAVPLAGPAVVTGHARPNTGKPKDEPAVTAPPANDDRKPAHAAASGEKPAIVTPPGSRRSCAVSRCRSAKTVQLRHPPRSSPRPAGNTA